MRARTKEPTTDAAPKEAKVRQRLSTQEREKQIVKGAITFFSERGLEGQTRDLAKDIGITHPLLYHYFPTKQALIERVYLEVYSGRWKREWEVWLDDKNVSLEEKLTHFYLDYAKTILTPEWVRIMVFSGLSDGYIPEKYLALLKQRLFPRIVNESRRHLGLSLRRRVTERENELLWGLHGGIFYIGIRQWVYNQPAPEDLTQIIKDRVRAYILAARELFGADE